MKPVRADDKIFLGGKIFLVEFIDGEHLVLLDQDRNPHIVSMDKSFLQVGDDVLYQNEKWRILYLNRVYQKVTLRQLGRHDKRVLPSDIAPLVGQNEHFLSLLKKG